MSNNVCLYILNISFRQNPHVPQQDWIVKPTKANERQDWGKIYQNVYSKYSYTETQRQQNLIEGKIPWDLSR